MYAEKFRVGQTYRRRGHIHQVYGGQQQSGISTPAREQVIFLFTGGSHVNGFYSDRWYGNIFRYSGEGQIGDMRFERGNKQLRDHAANGKELLLFQNHQAGTVEYLGPFKCVGHKVVRGRDRNGDMRNALEFQLMPLTGNA